MSDIPEGLDEFVAQAAPSPAINTPNPQAGTPPGLDDFIAPEVNEEKYGTPGQQAIAGAEAVGKGVAGPLATGAERLAGVPAEDILGREEANPITHTLGEVAGLVGSTMAGTGLGSLLSHAGESVAGRVAGAGIGALGTSVAKHAAENLVFQAGDEASKLILQDPNQSAETAALDMGLAGLIGGGFGTINPLWQATKGSLTGGILGAFADKVGGISSVNPSSAETAIAKSGMDIAPELKGLVSDNSSVQQMSRELSQTDTNGSGLEFQKSYKNMQNKAGDLLMQSLGKAPEEVASMPPISKYEAGKAIGDTLSKEFDEQLSPYSQAFEELKGKFKDVELPKDTISTTGQKVPGTISSIVDKVSQLAIDEGWTASPSSDIMHEVNRVIKEAPLQQNLKQLGHFISQVGNNTNKDLMNGPLRNAGGRIISTLKDAEADVIGNKLGAEAPELLDQFKAARQGYAVQSAMKEALDSRLGIKGSTSGFADALSDMARTDGEGVLRRLSGKNDAEALQFLGKHYPKTAEVIKNYHISDLLQNAASKAKDGSVIDNGTLLRNYEKMAPELRNFIAPPEAQNNIKAISTALDAFKNPNHNFSNTARVSEALSKHGIGTAVGMMGALMGHGVLGAVMGPLVNAIGKDVPDAIKLSLLKFLGSDKQINASGFKSMVDFIAHTIRGENTLSKATANIFKAGSEVIPPKLIPNDKDREKIKKAVANFQQNPDQMTEIAGQVGHYMPDHSTALSQTAANAVNYLNSQRPNTAPQNPFDSKRKLTPQETGQYNRTLDIAQQPLMVLKHIADGRITAQDVQTQIALYPGLYKRTVQKLTDNMTKAIAKGQTIPYQTRMGLSMYMGHALDSTMTPSGILAAQPQAPQAQPQTAIQPASNPKRSTASLSKMAGMYQTKSQAAEKDRANRD